MLRKTLPAILAISIFTLLFPFMDVAQESGRKIVSFPEHKRVVSPNRRYILENVDSDDEPYHTVFLEDKKRGTREKLFTYERHIELLWNPDSHSYALSNFAGSDYEICSIFSVSGKQTPILVLDDLLKRVSPREREAIQRNDHLYIAAVQWVSPKTLKVKIWGHDSQRRTEFSRFYLYQVREMP